MTSTSLTAKELDREFRRILRDGTRQDKALLLDLVRAELARVAAVKEAQTEQDDITGGGT